VDARSAALFLGPAGASKSTLTSAYARWLSNIKGAEVLKVNLDPVAEYLPYKPDFNVRSIINARDVALKYGLGPNGALSVSYLSLRSTSF